jgi:hypothetical protein
MTTALKYEIEGHKEIIDETLASNEIDNDEKMAFCDAIIKYLQEEKKGIEDFLEESSE